MVTKDHAQMTRRSFCNRALVTSAGLALTAGTVSGQSPNPDQNQPQSLLAYPPIRIQGAEQIQPGGFLYFDYPARGNAAVLIRGMDGQYLAFSRKCAHLGCSVDYSKEQRCLTCPCHRGIYDARTGYVMLGPPPRPLDQIVLQVRGGGEVWAVGKRTGGGTNVRGPSSSPNLATG